MFDKEKVSNRMPVIKNLDGYNVRVDKDDDVWIAHIPQLKDCVASGSTVKEAYGRMQSVYWRLVEQKKVIE